MLATEDLSARAAVSIALIGVLGVLSGRFYRVTHRPQGTPAT